MNALLSLYVYVKSWFEVEEGQDLIEYALIIALFVLVAVGALALLADPLESLWENIGEQLAAGGS